MPAAYAHHTFGNACIECMPDKLKNVCIRYRELFDIGVHGPDILFYFRPVCTNKIIRHGQELHDWSGMDFFSLCKNIYQSDDIALQKQNKQALLAYMLGFLAHFTLDSNCHDYINNMVVKTGLSHHKIESQYEAFLMRKDGRDPLKVDRSVPLKPNRKRAAIIAFLFPFTDSEILQSLIGQKQFLHMFYSPTECKKRILRKLLLTCKIKGNFEDLFIDTEVPTECEITNEQIYALQMHAEEKYPAMLESFMRYLYDRGDLISDFEMDFEGINHKTV